MGSRYTALKLTGTGTGSIQIETRSRCSWSWNNVGGGKGTCSTLLGVLVDRGAFINVYPHKYDSIYRSIQTTLLAFHEYPRFVYNL